MFTSSLLLRMRGLRRAFTALIAVAAMCVLLAATFASETRAAAELHATTDTVAAGAPTELNLYTELTGSTNETRQYGAVLTIPATMRIETAAYGGPTDMCPANAFSFVFTGAFPPAMAFNPTGCPAKAKIGTASLGSATGSIYFVDASPLPHMGVYFDSGVSTPYGRKIEMTFPGDGETRLQVNGLEKISTSGLTLNFNNPSRPSLSPKIWRFVSGSDGACEPQSYFYGAALIWPTLPAIWASPVSVYDELNMAGCGSSFSAVAGTPTAGSSTTLKVNVNLDGDGQDTHMFGTQSTLSPALTMPYSVSTLGTYSQMCPSSSYEYAEEEFPVGYYAETFDNAECPEASIVGTAKLGSMTGTIHVVDVSPVPDFGVYFDDGVDEPFGVKLRLSYLSSGHPVLTVAGLPDASTDGLELDFNNPSRADGLPATIWKFHGSSHNNCASAHSKNTLTNWLSSGTEVAVAAYHSDYMAVAGCA